MLNFDTISLESMTDAELAELESANTSGRKGIYPDVWKSLASHANGSHVAVVVSYSDVNPAAESRDTVIAGLKAAGKRLDKSGRFLVIAMSDADSVKLVCKAAKTESQ
jgi:hypothetical protein